MKSALVLASVVAGAPGPAVDYEGNPIAPAVAPTNVGFDNGGAGPDGSWIYPDVNPIDSGSVAPVNGYGSGKGGSNPTAPPPTDNGGTNPGTDNGYDNGGVSPDTPYGDNGGVSPDTPYGDNGGVSPDGPSYGDNGGVSPTSPGDYGDVPPDRDDAANGDYPCYPVEGVSTGHYPDFDDDDDSDDSDDDWDEDDGEDFITWAVRHDWVCDDGYGKGGEIPTPPVNPCNYYDDSDYEECVGGVEPTDLPTCEPSTTTVTSTETTGEPDCPTTTEIQTVEDVCTEGPVTVTETTTACDYCKPVTVDVNEPAATESSCAGTTTLEPETIKNIKFVYDTTVVHPIVIEYDTLYVTPDPVYITEYETTTVKVTQQDTVTEVETETVKCTETVTNTIKDGTTTIAYYHTETPAPVIGDVTKTIHVPVPCVDDVEVCPSDVYGGNGGVSPDGPYGYGPSQSPAYDDDFYDDVDDNGGVAPSGPSYGGSAPGNGGVAPGKGDYGNGGVAPGIGDYGNGGVSPGTPDYGDKGGVAPGSGDYGNGGVSPASVPKPSY